MGLVTLHGQQVRRSHLDLKLRAVAMEGNIVARTPKPERQRRWSQVGATSPESKKPINDEIAELEMPVEESGWSQEAYE